MNNLGIPNTQKGNVLIVDDDSMIRDMLEETIRRTGYSCCLANDGEDALEKLSGQEFDVVVTDIDMPVMNGIELSKTIKSKFTTDVIVMTGQIRSYQYAEIIDIGARDFVEKPFSPKEMILRIDRVIRKKPERNCKKSPRRPQRIIY